MLALVPPAQVQPPPVPTRHEVRTDDGWRLVLHRNAPHRTRAGRPPLLLVHGLLSNHRIWGLPGGPDLVQTLTEAGWDVWRLDLRGSTGSQAPAGTQPFDFSIDDHIHRDVAAALEVIVQATGAPKVILGGHSMGGLIALGAAQQEALASRIQGLLLVAPAIRVGDARGQGPRSSVLLHEMGALAALVPSGHSYPADELAAWAWRHPGSPAARLLLARGNRALWGEGQVDPDLARRIFTEAVGGTSSTVLFQFGRFARTLDTSSYAGRRGSIPSAFHAARGPWSYLSHLPDVKVPVRLLAGEGDRLVRVEHLVEAFDRLGSADKALQRLPGLGHVDLLLGKDAPAQAHPWILRALSELSR